MTSKKNPEYIRLEQPIPLRRKILETAIDSTEILRFFETYKSIKVEKISKIKKLRTLMGKIKREIHKLNKEIPESRIDSLKPKKSEKIKLPLKKKDKFTSLDEELGRIKEKLSKISIWYGKTFKLIPSM